VIQMLVDIVSKNGNLLLNFTQMPDGSLDEQCRWILKVLAQWMAINGEGIYGTRPWVTAGEGPTKPQHAAFKEDAVPWTPQDFRFTAKGNTVYAFQMKDPEGRLAAICALGSSTGRKVADVKLLGCPAALDWQQAPGALQVHLPDAKVGPCVPCFAVTLA
jgi:alpha-L-fucosidase